MGYHHNNLVCVKNGWRTDKITEIEIYDNICDIRESIILIIK